MRILVALLISLLMLSNVVNASMHCCMQSDEAIAEATTDTPCHIDAEHPETPIIDPQSECECPDCIQFNLADQLNSPFIPLNAAPSRKHSVFVAIAPDSIFYPPRSLS